MRQVIHRDLKLENLMLTSSNHAKAEAKLCDFGLSVLVAKAMPCVARESLKRASEAKRRQASRRAQ